ncbi:MAG: YdjY domain-containing protein [Thermoguttaceae bacterium]
MNRLHNAVLLQLHCRRAAAVAIASLTLLTACHRQSDPPVAGPPVAPTSTEAPAAAPEPEAAAAPATKPETAAAPDAETAGAGSSQPAEGKPSEITVSPPDEPQADASEEAEQPDGEGRLDFGEPLVEGLTQNERLDPKQPVWLTKDRKSVVVQSMVCQRQAPLEMFACLLNTKEHESVLTVPVKAFVIHAGLLAAGAEPGTPVRWDPEYAPPTGTEIEIEVLWKDEEGKVRKARAQEWVRDVSTGKAMAQPWVFAGSMMYEDKETSRKHYMADSSGDLICVSNFASATLDVPIRSSDANASLMFEAFTENIPPLGTPVTMVLTPKK